MYSILGHYQDTVLYTSYYTQLFQFSNFQSMPYLNCYVCINCDVYVIQQINKYL